MSKVDYDKYGHCVNCHKALRILKVVTGNDGKPVEQYMWLPDKDRVDFKLSDNSIMPVTICKECKDALTTKDYKKIMKSVQKGWDNEMDDMGWTVKQKKAYKDIYDKKSIKNKIKEVSRGISN